jgi:hypothetical protein
MSDTIRTKVALQTLLADNTTGDITPQKLRDFLVSAFDMIGPGSLGDGGSSNFLGFDSSGKQIFYGDAGLCFGEISVQGNSNTTALAVQNTWYQFTDFDTDGEYKNTTPDYTNGHITIDQDGTYLVQYSITSGFPFSATDSFEYQVYINNGATPYVNTFQEQYSGDLQSTSITSICTFTALDTVELWCRCTTASSKNLAIENAVLNVVQIGG